jgi:hypothetical protein
MDHRPFFMASPDVQAKRKGRCPNEGGSGLFLSLGKSGDD